MAGLLSGFKGYKLVSNRESGNGRPDLILKQRNGTDIAIVIEIKAANPKKHETLEGKLKEAFEQIEKNNYAEELRNDGFQTIIQYGVSFREKQCMIGVAK